MRMGNLEHCDGALIRAYSRRLATVVSVGGAVHADNAARLTAWARRHVLDDDVILDLGGLDAADAACSRLVADLAVDCRAAGVDFVVVADAEVVTAGALDDADTVVARSVPEALRYFADANSAVRQALLPLLGRTA
jgi:anti-anti-sigma regulatory factor